MQDSSEPRQSRTGVVPHLEVCPACGAPMQGRACKVYCVTPACELFGRIVENCAGD
ncbi:MAG TPA: hypothetical protein VGK20_04000 [Candidatus Binatia bacterium]|jgi:hypothetical protein